MAEDDQKPASVATALPSLEEMQHWTWVIGRAQQLMMEFAGQRATNPPLFPSFPEGLAIPHADAAKLGQVQADFWRDSIRLWQGFMAPGTLTPSAAATATTRPDPRFAAAEWQDNPLFALIHQTYAMVAQHLLNGVDAFETDDPRQRDRLRFVAQAALDALSPSNFPLTNPQVLARTLETRGQNLLTGLERMLADLGRGQLTQTDSAAFELGRNIAATPGKVIHETPLYQLIQYDPVTPQVFETPVVIFPPWINRFYILDLGPKKSFVRWAVENGLTVFMVSWRSADETMADVTWDDYVAAQIDAVDTIRKLLGVEGVHAIGYCVSGTTLAATLAVLEARGQAARVATATFFTAQIDFSQSGDLNLFVGDEQLKLIDTLSAQGGFLDGRFMAATFNLLRGRELIWNYVVNNYLLGADYLPFDLLHWNSDVTNLPARWHKSYLEDLYRDNKLVSAGAVTVLGVPIDLSKVKTPSYIQAGRDDHIAPAASVWKMLDHFTGPMRFVLAGSGHIAGVVNPPDSGKYQYWTSSEPADSLEAFIASATETKGSWWPNWLEWLSSGSPKRVSAKKARIPGKGELPAIEDAPGRYVRTR
ncbi:PHA/PHB synthase family protein [Sphingomonas sp. ID0503]|uniref:PHA/PHB synthase family protein n=1 Tax=Sphingomonas sp. ID0503 TaxID=3399691 RepID=UPI003AFA8992